MGGKESIKVPSSMKILSSKASLTISLFGSVEVK